MCGTISMTLVNAAPPAYGRVNARKSSSSQASTEPSRADLRERLKHENRRATTSFSSEEDAPSAQRPSTNSQRTSSMQSDEGGGATTRAPNEVVEDALTLSANGRKRTVMARYVFGNEDKPGGRWKRRLLRSR